MTYKTRNGAHPSIKINVLNKLPKDRLLLALKRVRQAIANGRPLIAYDDTTPGNKCTSCSWGLCHDSAETWPDAQDHIFPVDFERRKRVSTLDYDLKCPMVRDPKFQGGGCFWVCRVFQADKAQPRPTKDEALKLYDEAISRLSGKKA